MPIWSVTGYLVPAIYLLANLYLYLWTKRWLKPSRSLVTLIFLIFFILALLFPLGKILGRHEFNSFSYLISYISSLWMGFTFFSAILALASDLFMCLIRKISRTATPPFVSSIPFRRMAVAVIFVCVMVLGGCAIREARNIRITSLEIPLRALPPQMDGLSVVQVSDVHYGMLQENGRLSGIVARINELSPDLVVFTGDLVDENVSHMEMMGEPLSHLKSRLGVFAVTGNHEYYAGVDRVVGIMRGAGVHVLRNERVVLPGGLQLMGIDDSLGCYRVGAPQPDFDKYISLMDPGLPSILLYHQSSHFQKTAAAHIGLQLSGHTHGSQLLPMRPLSKILFPHLRGLYHQGESYQYVSRGVGTGGPPMRLGSPPELVYIRLRSIPQ